MALKTARLQHRLTQKELAHKAGVSLTTVKMAEYGARPALRSQRALARAMKLNAEATWPTKVDS